MLKKLNKISKQLKNSSTMHNKQGVFIKKYVKSIKKTNNKGKK
jgi:hypothetical protein